MAPGVDRARVVRLLIAGGLKLVVVGGALGLVLALAAPHLLGGLLLDVDTLDPLTFVGVPLVPRRRPARRLAPGPPRQPGQSRHRTPNRLTSADERHGPVFRDHRLGRVPATEPDLRFGIERRSDFLPRERAYWRAPRGRRPRRWSWSSRT